jgi:NitT/TauT family transport system substrate-binding protein
MEGKRLDGISRRNFLFGTGAVCLSLALGSSPFIMGGCKKVTDDSPIGLAVEFTDHAACAYIAQAKGYFEEKGLNLTTYESYVTGTALASALVRGDIQAAYICLTPAISTYANAGVPLKIVAGSHKYGYGLAVNPQKIATVKDLEKEGMRIGCVQTGSATDVLLQKLIEKYDLDKQVVTNNIRQMNPPKQLLAIQAGQLDAVCIPEQWVTMSEDMGFEMMLTAEEVWPDLQGSVLIVKDELIDNHPEIVENLVEITQKATDWAVNNPEGAAEIMAAQLQAAGDNVFPTEVAETAKQLDITPSVMLRSMERLEYTTDIEPAMVQDMIDYMASLEYIKSGFSASDILDLSFLK